MAENAFTAEWLARHQAKLQKGSQGPPGAVEGPSSRRSSVRPRKYRNQKAFVTFAGLEIVKGHQQFCHDFDSTKEAQHYRNLTLRRQAGEITELRLQEPFAIIARRPDGSGQVCGEYFADFVFWDVQAGCRRVQDVKSEATKQIGEYRLKKKIVEACHGVQIEEV